MGETEHGDSIIGKNDLILITGATGFMGPRLVQNLLGQGYRNLRCFSRPSSETAKVESLTSLGRDGVRIEVVRGNLLSPHDCIDATKDVAVIYHLAAGRGEKSFPDAFMNSVVTTRNLAEACLQYGCLKRFVNVSSFAVYTNTEKARWRLLDESCPVETHPELRGDAYCFAKVNQDEIITDLAKRRGLPYVIVRPGAVYGPGNLAITGRVGIDGFGVFLHLGGSNTIPLTYVDNCVDAIALAGLRKGIDGEVFNIIDDDLPTSRQFLRFYKREVRPFRSLYVPHVLSYSLCYFWERYYRWSEGQLPLSFNRKKWHAIWKKTRYSNEKLKALVGWSARVSTEEGLRRYSEACRCVGEKRA
jgi:nucleoside-diphosphate-sugar epimerase